jgi:hypothetical protein
MPAVTTLTPAGVAWRVRVVWHAGRRPLVRRIGGWKQKSNPFAGVELPDLDDGPDYTPLVRRPELMDQPRPGPSFTNSKLLLTLIIILLVLGGAVIWWVLLPLALLIADAAIVGVGLPLRIVTGKRFTVEATSPIPNRSPGTMVIATQVPGWRAAHRRRDEIAAQLGDGVPARKIGRIRLRA